jgi:hypothetical protein
LRLSQTSEFVFVANFRHFEKMIWKRISCRRFPVFFTKNSQKLKKNLRSCQNSPQLCLQVLQNFFLSYFECCQIRLNILIDDCHLINITKLKRKTLSQKGDHPQESLAKFGYRPDTKLEKF